jgi:sugar phosphate isomerase/epimerase
LETPEGIGVTQRRRLSLAYLTVEGAGPVEMIEAAAAAGFDSASPRVIAPTHAPLAEPVVGNAPLIRAIRRACAQSGITLVDAEVVTLGPRFDRAVVAAAVETIAELGFTFIQVVSEENDEAAAIDQFGFLSETAGTLGLGLALEFMRFRACQNLEDANRLVRTVRNAGILVDPLHLARSGGHPRDIAGVPPARIAMLQLCDAHDRAPPVEGLPREAREARLNPGDGALPLRELIAATPAGLPISVEVPHSALRNLPVRERAQRAYVAAARFLGLSDQA